MISLTKKQIKEAHRRYKTFFKNTNLEVVEVSGIDTREDIEKISELI